MKKLPSIARTVFLIFALAINVQAQDLLLKPDRVFDGEAVYQNWEVAVTGGYITYAGPAGTVKPGADTQIIEMPDLTLIPGMIEGHSHVLLHPYNEAAWNDQVLKESRALRVARATNHVRNTVMAGFTTIRDLGSEGAAYADVGIKQAIDKGIIVGPRMIVAGRAIVATGSYGPKGYHADFNVPLGAEEADGEDDLIRVVRDQIGKGADVVKMYADYRWGPNGEAMPTFTESEIRLAVDVSEASGRMVVAHASTEKGIENAVLGGARTIEHGDDATDRILELMKERGVAWFPTLAAVEAISMYGGWSKGTDPDPDRIAKKKEVFRKALALGVTIGLGSDVGVFTHGKNAWELELMVEYGMTPLEAMKAATSINASVLNLPDRGWIREGYLADLVATGGNPTVEISSASDVRWVMVGGRIVRQPE